MDNVTPDSAETDELLERVQAGDRQAFEQLFARHLPYLRRVIGLRMDPRLRPRVDATDVVQETQLEAYRRLADYLERRPMPFRLWLRKTACERVQIMERYHGRARRRIDREVAFPERSSLQLVAHLLASGSTASQRLERAEASHRLAAQRTGLLGHATGRCQPSDSPQGTANASSVAAKSGFDKSARRGSYVAVAGSGAGGMPPAMVRRAEDRGSIRGRAA